MWRAGISGWSEIDSPLGGLEMMDWSRRELG
jgi:hypothetical protein